MTCPKCKTLLDVPSEVTRGLAIGVCSTCDHLFGPAVPKQPAPDPRGRPSTPGGSR